MVSSLILTLSLSVAASATVTVSLTGGGLAPSAVAAIEALPAVDGATAEGDRLSLTLAAEAEVSVNALQRLLDRHASGIRVDTARLVVGPHTIFQLDAGVCFFCTERPLGETLGRRSFVESWSVVDYRERGRLRFRIRTRGEVRGAALDVDSFEDVILTARYDGRGKPDLYWPTGGVAWRPDVESARREATTSKKPLMIFPTAGT